MSKVIGYGRLGNQLVRNMAALLLVEKYNLVMELTCEKQLIELGIKVKKGTVIFDTKKVIKDKKYWKYYTGKNKIKFNVSMKGFYQTKLITNEIHKWLNSESIRNSIISKNKFNSRYKNNNDCFVHIRLGDVEKWNPGIKYYLSIISSLQNIGTIYIATDSPTSNFIRKLKYKLGKKKITIVTYSLTDIILFGSTCKHVILSYGTFSAMIGYFSFYSTVYCLRYCKEYAWDFKSHNECDMFRDKSTQIGPWIVNG